MFNNSFGCSSPIVKQNNSFMHHPTALNVQVTNEPAYDILGVSPVKREARYTYNHSKSMGPPKSKLAQQQSQQPQISVIPIGPNLSVDGSQAMLAGHNQKFIKNNQNGVRHSAIKFNQNQRPALGRVVNNTEKKHVQMQKFFSD